jgi:hypothetical protein
MLLKIETFILYVNCKTFTSDLQLRNVDEKFMTFIFWSNKSVGTDVSAVHAKKQDANVNANGTLSNNPLGTEVKVVIASNVFANVVALGE